MILSTIIINNLIYLFINAKIPSILFLIKKMNLLNILKFPDASSK